MRALEDKSFIWLLVAVSLAFAWILWPFFGAVLWGTVFAVVFAPLQRRLARAFRGRRSLAALTTILIIVLIVILPLTLIGASLVEQGVGVYNRMRSGELNFGRYLQQVFEALPPWAAGILERFGILDLGDLWERLSAGLMKGGQFLATRAASIGQNTFQFIVQMFVMLYLLFFLLRDGDEIARRIRAAVPLGPEQRQGLFRKFTQVIRATVKGNVVIAVLQGVLGGLIFWLLGIHAALFWAVVMAILSLLPAVGTALVWGPVAIYFIATGSVWQGIVLVAYGILVIGLVDNVVRPILVGKDTKMPDYIVLISTLGGLAVFGVNGFVIGPLIAALFMVAWSIFAAPRTGEAPDLGD
ncbi:MAG TPA: AI-2E family transporter [Burkholderiales bacterium]|nr:AI-2E family transporter [Burkholderiales bacterium]